MQEEEIRYYDSTLTGQELDAALKKVPQIDAALAEAQRRQAEAAASADTAAQKAEAAAASAEAAAQSAAGAAASADTAGKERQQAAQQAEAADASAQAARASQDAAAQSQADAAGSAGAAQGSASAAAESEDNAGASAAAAAQSEQAAESWAGLAQSWAVGEGAPDAHPEEATDNARAYAEQARASAADAAGSVEVIRDNADAIQAMQTHLDAILSAADNALTAQSAAGDAAASAATAQEAADRAQSIAQGALGYYATAAGLREAYETGENGQWAIIGETDTIWVWDSDNSEWTDSGQKMDLSDYYTKAQTDAALAKQQAALTDTLADVAFTGEYSSLQGLPALPSLPVPTSQGGIGSGDSTPGTSMSLTDGPEWYWLHAGFPGNKFIDLAAAVSGNRARINVNGTYQDLYSTAFKPTAADVGLGNVTNAKQMPIAGGTFTGNAIAYRTNRNTACLRNTEVRITSVTGALQSTNCIIMVRV